MKSNLPFATPGLTGGNDWRYLDKSLFHWVIPSRIFFLLVILAISQPQLYSAAFWVLSDSIYGAIIGFAVGVVNMIFWLIYDEKKAKDVTGLEFYPGIFWTFISPFLPLVVLFAAAIAYVL
jgi:hypothetical protein